MWGLVIPVKRLDRAKTRLRDLSAPTRRRLALAFALDTVEAALACPAVETVHIVTPDETVAAALRHRPVEVVSEPGDGNLNGAIGHAAARVPAGPTAVVTADLPAATPDELAAALAAAGGHDRAFVPDADDVGTVLLAALRPDRLRPRFGDASRDAHRATGAVELPGAWPGLRRDIDTAADLARAERLGLGRHTRNVLSDGPVGDRL